MNLLATAGNVIRWIASICAPMFVRPAFSPGLFWALHFLVVVLITVGLWFVHNHFALTVNIDGPRWMRQFWLSILFLLIYLLAWLGWWLWKLFQPSESASPFPDIDDAWKGVLQALEKAGIGIGDTPVFVVLGQAQADGAKLFAHLTGGLAIAGAPNESAPVRVYASREAIYLTCAGVCLLGVEEGTGSGGLAAIEFEPTSSMALDKTININNSIGMTEGGGEMVRQMQQIMRTAQAANRSLTEHEKELIRQLTEAAALPGNNPATPRKNAPSVLQNALLVERMTGRTRYFCSLLAKARWPLCPINGAVILVSVAAAEKTESAQQTGLVAQRDMANLVDCLGLRFPLYALLADLNLLPGSDEFIRRFPPDLRQKRLGKNFPLNPDLKPSSAPAAIETSVRWIFDSLLPYWVYKFFRLETPNVESPQQAVEANERLFQYMAAVKNLSANAASLISRAVIAKVDETPCYGGCYVTATDAGGAYESLFLQDFFKKVESTQGFVAWTDEAIALDASYRAKTKLGYTLLGIVALVVFALAVYVFGIRSNA